MAARIDKKREINGVLYLAAALLLAFAYYWPEARMGWLGRFFLDGGRGLLGVCALALPVVFLYMAIDYLLEKRMRVTRLRFTYVFILLIATAALLQTVTISLADIRQLSFTDEKGPLAFAGLRRLWQTGVDPSILNSPQRLLPGGLLGGLLALAIESIAGSTGSIIILAALILSMLVLLLNVSLTRAVGQTAQVIRQTQRKVNQAVQSSVTSLRQQRRDEKTDRGSYDLKLEADAGEGKADKTQSAGQHGSDRESWVSQLRRLWSPHGRGEEEAAGQLPQADLSIPGFLTDQEPAADLSASERNEPQNDPQDRLTQASPYDLRVRKAEWITAPSGDEETPVIPVIGGTEMAGHDADRLTEPLDQAEHKPDDSEMAGHPEEAPHIEAAEQLTEESDRHAWNDRSHDPGAAKAVKPAAGSRQLNIWQPPPLDLLTREAPQKTVNNQMEINRLGRKLEQTLNSFGIEAKVVRHSTGPTITRFELTPGPGVKVSRIVSLSDDIALNLAAIGVRIEAPIPGKAAIGIEIPNKETTPVLLRNLLQSEEYQQSRHEPLTVALGRDIQGRPLMCDLTRMPHLLIAGATGSGKSVCINSILMSILFKARPDEVKMVMIDPKVVELNVYNGIPHLITPVVTDPKKAANALIWAVNEMTRRYGLFADKSVRDIKAYQAAAERDQDDSYEKLPLMLLVIDELSDLMATTPTEVEDAIARLTAMARAAGIHLIIATQRPSVDVITGVIKANIPSRIAFSVASQVDSRTILDTGGAEKLLGKGDMLYYPQSAAKPVRGQGAFISDPEVERVLNYIKGQHQADYDESVTDVIMTASVGNGRHQGGSDDDELLPQALETVVETGYASVSLLQRRMNVGYPRAARLIDSLHDRGFVGPFEGSKPRKVLITRAQLMELQAKGDMGDAHESS